jgi:hypothetical protein
MLRFPHPFKDRLDEGEFLRTLDSLGKGLLRPQGAPEWLVGMDAGIRQDAGTPGD